MLSRLTLAATLLLSGCSAAVPRNDQAAPTVPAGSLVVDGRGYGHGVGLSQWGAYGLATAHGWDWTAILAHYYGGTRLESATPADFAPLASGRITVSLSALDGRATTVVSDLEPVRWVGDPSGGAYGALSVREVAGTVGRYQVWASATRGCPSSLPATGWQQIGESAGPVRLTTARADDPAATVRQLIGVCEPSGIVRTYRGGIVAANGTAGEDRTVNDVALEQYLRGVVPREVAGSWGDHANGAGMNALRAQAVAARSYALADGLTSRSRTRYSYAKTCDTQSCQVYGGAATRPSAVPGGPYTMVEDARTDRAVAETAGRVLRAANGLIATAMFSASNGGRTAGGPFPAVDDPGDSIPANPNHVWRVTIAASRVGSAWPQIGSFTGAQVTTRSGGGTWGGRADQVRVTGTTGSVTVTGDQFRIALGLKSRWIELSVAGH
jgi:SpoIID/LytB domain protein